MVLNSGPVKPINLIGMDIQGISKQTLSVPQLIRAEISNNRIALPVNSNRIYAHFKHIKGIGSMSNQPAFSLAQLRHLDNLIDRLKLLKGGVSNVNLEGASGNDITKMIEEYRVELHTELGKNNPYSKNLSVSALSLNIFA